ncbi:MAG: DUF1727 domain-containing protein [Streptosporangiales bacterium]|nr:DUF1727 domain-containing protein [Streptosporangiales bacterium]
MTKLGVRAQLATALGGAAATLSRWTGRGDGSVIGGRVGLTLEPALLSRLAADRRLALVSGTNGKTTTTRLVAAALRDAGDVASNAFGANMPSGHVTALSQGRDAPYAVLEVDEKYVPLVLEQTGASVVVLLNLSRDQMDRAAETWILAQRWRTALTDADTHVVANADDPLVAWSAGTAKQVTWVAAGQRWRDDSWCCPECGSHLLREEVHWQCDKCGLTRPEPSWWLDGPATAAAAVDPRGRRWDLDLRLPGRVNRTNALIALAAAAVFGISVDRALPHLAEVASVAGRYTVVERDGREVRLLLAKNPAGWLEAFDVLEPAPTPVLLSVNAQGPDGRDTSWLWDVDYRVLAGRPVFVTGERRLDLAVRLEVDKVDFELVRDIDEAVERVPPGRLAVIANYTAFQAIRTSYGRAL